MRKIAILLAVLISLFSITVEAAPNITVLSVSPTSTTITLTWSKIIPVATTSTIIRYSTTSYPVNQTDGLSAYNGTGYTVALTGLTPGTSYYFSAWGYDGGYSTTVYNIVATTLYTDVASGAAAPTPGSPSMPNIPSSFAAAPQVPIWNIRPVSDFINVFNGSPGGLGMPGGNLWEFIANGLIAFVGILVYTKTNSKLMGWIIIMFLSGIAVSMHLTQSFGLIIFVFIGMGGWALEAFGQQGG